MNKRTRQIPHKTLICLLSAISALSLTACGNDNNEVKAEVIRPAKIITVGDPLAGVQRVYPGEVEAGDRSEQAFRVGGELVKLPAKAGLKVKKGQLLAQLDASDFQLRVDEQQARFDLTQVQFDRTEKLVKQQLIPISDFDTAKSNLLAAKADLRLAKANLSYTELRAPFDGVVSKLNVKNHENVRKNEVVLVIQTVNDIDITFQLSENIISRLKKGSDQKAQPKVVFDTYPDKSYETSVKEFDSEANATTRTYKVTLTMPSPKDFIALPGMSVNVHLNFNKLVESETAKIVIPIEAVYSPENDNLKSRSYQVWKLDNDTMKTQATKVTIGQITSSGIEITSGLTSGDQVITAGVNFIKEGQTVKPWVKEAGL
ncbi:MAG: efflux RND transporter periplasmic adaptor subunit [endosymbiont of Galathealinum brachiosum]|uniref:Efflux RND transporter periplasmic adaptor subunit n=1 Tax=endosymbiont of Galathealinum brachiosum TaxID=2200906 RepID=A0A370DI91_9GAMM|nr:MAG: efflux RND transporter periplasmic adaptor subunit [endosymbiont of Galathealinum brachiosum]